MRSLRSSSPADGINDPGILWVSARIILQLNSTEPNCSRLPTAKQYLGSVVVVNWNRRELLACCLDSLRAQRAVSFEVVVVDNGSTDNSPDLVCEFADSVDF